MRIKPTRILVVSVLSLLFSFIANAQQSTTLTAIAGRGSSPGNIVGGWCVKIDDPTLNGNPNAIVVAEPLTAGYPHGLTVWYRQQAWHVCNINQQTIPARAQFHIRYWPAPASGPGGTAFVHKVTQQNLRADRLATRVDHPSLNSYPSAGWSVYQALSNERNDALSAHVAKGEYDDAEKKWFLVNEGGAQFSIGNSYNIVVMSSGQRSVVTPDVVNTSTRPGGPPIAPGNAPAGAGGIVTYFRNDPTLASVALPPELTQTVNALPSLEHAVTLAKRSRLVINAAVLIGSTSDQSAGTLRVKINGQVEASSASIFNLSASTSSTVEISGYMVDRPAGSYTVQVEIVRYGSNAFQVVPLRSSIIQIPIE